MLKKCLILFFVIALISCTSKEPPIKEWKSGAIINWVSQDIADALGGDIHSIHEEVGEVDGQSAAIMSFNEQFSDFNNFINSFNRWANKYRGLNYEYRWMDGMHPAALMKLEGDPEFYLSFLFPEGWPGRFVIIVQNAEHLPETTDYPNNF